LRTSEIVKIKMLLQRVSSYVSKHYSNVEH